MMHFLNLDLPIAPAFDLSPVKALKLVSHTPLTSSATNQVSRFLAVHGLFVTAKTHFFMTKNSVIQIHTDITYVTNSAKGQGVTKLNFVFGGSGSKVSWWKPNDPNNNPPKLTSDALTPYSIYKVEECTRIERAEVNGALLFDGGTPHSIVNADEERHCFSFALFSMKTKKPVTFEQACEMLKGFARVT